MGEDKPSWKGIEHRFVERPLLADIPGSSESLARSSPEAASTVVPRGRWECRRSLGVE
jgi:hypothetical protein